MADLNLNNQQAAVAAAMPTFVAFKNQMDKRKAIWDRISVDKREAWAKSDKDPVMSLALDLYKYLNRNFFGEDFRDG